MATPSCPHCGKTGFIPDVAFENAKNYGSNYYNVGCVHCHKAVSIHLYRTVVVSQVKKTTGDLDWPA